MKDDKKVYATKVEMIGTGNKVVRKIKRLFSSENTEEKIVSNVQINRNGRIVHCKNCKCNVFSKLEGGNYSCNKCGTSYNVVEDE